MNWMIDGLYGDLYRTAMGYRQLQPHDDWQPELQAVEGPGLIQRAMIGLRQIWAKARVALQPAGLGAFSKERTVS
jgi:hypothetical protein